MTSCWGLTPCFKVHIVKPLDLQRTEKSFNLLFLEPLKSVSGCMGHLGWA